jgi:hypothetical protein
MYRYAFSTQGGNGAPGVVQVPVPVLPSRAERGALPWGVGVVPRERLLPKAGNVC